MSFLYNTISAIVLDLGKNLVKVGVFRKSLECIYPNPSQKTHDLKIFQLEFSQDLKLFHGSCFIK
jgi:hypothetical protein